MTKDLYKKSNKKKCVNCIGYQEQSGRCSKCKWKNKEDDEELK